MKRKVKPKPAKNVDAILTADWHLREDTPECRIDDFEQAQWHKVKEVARLQKKYDCPVFHSGDLFHHWKPSPSLITKCLQNLPENFHTVYGNHDLPQHSMKMADKSGVTTLYVAGKIDLLFGGNWNHVPDEYSGIEIISKKTKKKRLIHVWHVYTYTGREPYPGAAEKDQGHVLLKKYPQFDMIVTGDNHITFVCKNKEGQILVNPGSLTRQTAAQADHDPCVFLYDAETNTVRRHDFKVDTDAVTRSHIEGKEERDERLSAFVSRLGEDWEADLDFSENVKKLLREKEIDEAVQQICFQALDPDSITN